MSNRILLEWEGFDSTKRESRVFPLTDDPQIELASQFQNLSDLLPGQIQSLMNFMQTVGKAGGGVGKTVTTMQTLPLWNGTDPLRLVAKLIFYVKDDPKEDVWKPVNEIASQAILKKDGKRWKTPGASFKSFSNMMKDKKTQNTDKNPMSANKFNYVSVEIPGVVYLPIALIMSAKPTFSKEVTIDNYPLWAVLDVEIRSIVPANDVMLQQSKPISGGGILGLLS